VRWFEGGKRRVRRFIDETEAREFAATVSPTGGQDIATDVKRGDGVHVYETNDGPRYPFSRTGRWTSKRRHPTARARGWRTRRVVAP
jgi:hypothetical protein